MRTILLGCAWVFVVLGLATYWVLAPFRAARVPHVPEVAAAPHGEEGGEQGGEQGGERGGEVVFGGPKIPKSIVKRRKGKPEPGHDLVDPEVSATRGLASVLDGKDLKVEFERHYVELPEITASTRVGQVFAGKALAIVVLEVDSFEASHEVTERKLELQSLVSSLMSERQREVLFTTEGVFNLKTDLQREINHVLKKGRVTDVLFTNFYIF